MAQRDIAAPAARTDAHFDADALAAAQRGPTLTLGRLLYRGRLLSIEEWLPFWERLQTLERPAADVLPADQPNAILRARTVFYREYLTAVFPRSRFRFWAPDPVAHLLRQPFQVVEETVAFFFILQVRATFGEDAIESATSTLSRPRGDDSKSRTTSTPPAEAE